VFRNKEWFFIPVVTMTLVTGCASRPAYEQEFQGLITKDKKAAAAVRVRLIAGSADTCDKKGLDAVTDGKGKFRLRQTYKPGVFDTGSTARLYRLCVQNGDTWETLWAQVKAPPPKTVDFECDLADRFADKCWVSWDKDGFRKGAWNKYLLTPPATAVRDTAPSMPSGTTPARSTPAGNNPGGNTRTLGVNGVLY
jgi:hypothetical protein